MGRYYYDGANALETPSYPEYDMNCPEMGKGLNCYRSQCLLRQKDENQATCYKGCKSKAGIPVEKKDYKRDGRYEKVVNYLREGKDFEWISKKLSLEKRTVSRIKYEAKKKKKQLV